MKLKTLSLLFYSLLLFHFSNAQSVGFGAGTPNSSAQADINSSSKGLLIPRMNTVAIGSILNPAKGLMVYDSAKNLLMINMGTPPVSNWQALIFNNGWKLAGNSSTNPAVNFIGTKDNQPLRFRVNNISSGQIDSVSNLSFFGYGAGKGNTSGYGNSALGSNALLGNTTGKFNTAAGDSALSNSGLDFGYDNNTTIGYYALPAPTGSFVYENTGVGAFALWNIAGSANVVFSGFLYARGASCIRDSTTVGYGSMTTQNNTSIGTAALSNNQATGTGNTAIGRSALGGVRSGGSNTATGSGALSTNGYPSNTASGYAALFSQLSGSNNTATGAEAMRLISGGDNNTAIGRQALYNSSTHEGNTAVGVQALYSNTSGNENTALGYYALHGNISGSGNTAAGEQALFFSLGDGNTAIGGNALYNISGSYSNTAVGYNSGAAYIPGVYNTMVGANCNISTPGLFNCVAIGQDVTCTASNQIRIGNAATYSIGGYADWSWVSDGRFKKEIKEEVKGLDFVMMLHPLTYHLDVTAINNHVSVSRKTPANGSVGLMTTKKESVRYSGFIAQDVEQAASKLGYHFSGIETPSGENSVYGLRYDEFVAPLVKAMQEQQQQITLLKKQNDELLNACKEEEALYQQIIEKLGNPAPAVTSTKN